MDKADAPVPPENAAGVQANLTAQVRLTLCKAQCMGLSFLNMCFMSCQAM